MFPFNTLHLAELYSFLSLSVIVYPTHSQYWSNWFDGSYTGSGIDSTPTLSATDGSHITKLCTKTIDYIVELEVTFANGESGGPLGIGDGSVAWECFEVQENNECFASINIKQGSLIDNMQIVTSNGRLSSVFGGNGGQPYTISGSDNNDCISQLQFKTDDDRFRGIRAYFISMISSTTIAPTQISKTTDAHVSTETVTTTTTTATQEPHVATETFTTTATQSRTLTSNIPNAAATFTSTTNVVVTFSDILKSDTPSPVSNDVVTSKAKASKDWIYIVILSVVFINVCVCAIIVVLKLRRKEKEKDEVDDAEMVPNVTVLKMKSVSSEDIEVIEEEKETCTKDEIQIKEWMANVCHLPQYYGNFTTNGFDTMEFIMDIKGKTDLKDIGIVKVGHQVYIMNEIKKLKDMGNPQDTNDVVEGITDAQTSEDTYMGETYGGEGGGEIVPAVAYMEAIHQRFDGVLETPGME